MYGQGSLVGKVLPEIGHLDSRETTFPWHGHEFCDGNLTSTCPDYREFSHCRLIRILSPKLDDNDV